MKQSKRGTRRSGGATTRPEPTRPPPGEDFEAFKRRLQADHQRCFVDYRDEAFERTFAAARARWEVAGSPSSPARQRPVFVEDRLAFLAALDRNAPHILASLDWLPAQWTDDHDRVDTYVEDWVAAYPILRTLPWFVVLAKSVVTSQDRTKWEEGQDWDEAPYAPVGSLIPGPGSEIHPSQSCFDREPITDDEWEDRRQHLASWLQWNPFHETEDDYLKRVQKWAGRYVRRVKKWQAAEGYPELPSPRQREIPFEKRWDLLVRREVLNETLDQLRRFLKWDRSGSETDTVLIETIRAYAARLGVTITRRPPGRPRTTNSKA